MGAAAEAETDAAARPRTATRTVIGTGTPRARSLALDLTMLGIIGILLIAAGWATVAVLHREVYSPSAFVERYVNLLADGRAADALEVPGVAIDATHLQSAGLAPDASDALLRPAALGRITDVKVIDETVQGDRVRVTVSYRAGPHPATTSFSVEQTGTIGLAPTWRFARSPLALVELTVLGSMRFEVNGFEIDKRQVLPEGIDADLAQPIPLLVFTPGIYSVSVDTAISATPGVAVLSDSPLTQTDVTVQAEPTEEFQELVQSSVDDFLAQCATQEVLHPSGCPFGLPVFDRVVSPPVWSIVDAPVITVQPDGTGWRIPPTDATAHIEVAVKSLFDGTITETSTDVPFVLTGTIEITPDGTVSISVGGD